MYKKILYINMVNVVILKCKKLIMLAAYLIILSVVNRVYKIDIYLNATLMVLFIIYLKMSTRIGARKRLVEIDNDWVFSYDLPDHTLDLNMIGLTRSDIDRIRNEISTKGEEILADIDQDGYFFLRYPININVPRIDQANYIERSKYKVSLVALSSCLAIKKEYNGNYMAFLNELIALMTLARKCSTPVPLRINVKKNIIYMSYIQGSTLREIIAKEGAKILDRDNLIKEKRCNLIMNKAWLSRVIEGRKHVCQVVNSDTIKAIYNAAEEVHKHGICLYDVKYGNIIIEQGSGRPYFIDFENCIVLRRKKSLMGACMRKYDFMLLDIHFN